MRNLVVRLLCCCSFSLLITVPALGANQTYTVVRGDTLSSIAQREHVGVNQIVNINHMIDANYLREGQVLRLSLPDAVPPRAAKPSLKPKQTKTALHTTKHASARHIAERKPWVGSPAQVAQHQALWVAMHTGFSVPDFAGNPSFAAAQKAIALELRLTKTALRYLGVPYSWGGESFSGVDCSGFVQAVFRRNGIELPRTADAQFEVGRRVSSAGLQPGDLVFFQTYAEGASHVGIYLGSGQFVHASSSNGVRVDSLSETYYSSRYIGARRAAI